MQLENRVEMIAGYFHNEGHAQKAAHELHAAGFAQIGVASRDPKHAEKIAGKADVRPGVAASPGSGGELDQVFGESQFADPRDFRGALEAASLPTEQCDFFDDRLRRGGALVTVQAPAGREADARRILSDHKAEFGAESDRAVESAAPAPKAATPAAAMDAPTMDASAGDENTIRLHGELLRIHKERVQRGEVRLRKEIVTERQRVEVPVSREELVVDRRPASEAPSAGEGIGDSREIRIPLSEERVQVEKQPTVVEEVEVGKRAVQGTEPVDEEVRREKLVVENEGDLSPEELAKLRDKGRRAA